MPKLFLDDYRIPGDCAKYMHTKLGPDNFKYLEPWVVVRDYDEFRRWIVDNGLPSIVSFDHDLGEDVAEEARERGYSNRQARALKKECKSGMDCAKWLIDYCFKYNQPIPTFFVHSMNPVGAENIQKLLENAKNHQTSNTVN